MKKIIIWIIFGFLMINSVFADVLIPWQERPNYNQGCIDQCKKVTWDNSAVCKYSCVRWHEEYTKENIVEIFENPLFILVSYILVFSFFYFLLNKLFWKQIKKNYQKGFLFSIFSIILTLCLIISFNLLFYNI